MGVVAAEGPALATPVVARELGEAGVAPRAGPPASFLDIPGQVVDGHHHLPLAGWHEVVSGEVLLGGALQPRRSRERSWS